MDYVHLKCSTCKSNMTFDYEWMTYHCAACLEKTMGSPAGCRHEFKKYVGFREVYEYCTKCDKKVESNG